MKPFKSDFLRQFFAAFASVLAWLLVHGNSTAQLLAPPKPSSAPTLIPAKPSSLRMTFVTGGDDLRGGNDNLDVHVVLRDRSIISFHNVNAGQAWPNNARNVVERPLLPVGRVREAADIVAIRLEFHGSGGVGGDNWNLDEFSAELVQTGKVAPVLQRSGRPFARFTGDNRVVQLRTSGTGPVEVAPIRTTFEPAVHGFRFTNLFKIPVVAFDIV